MTTRQRIVRSLNTRSASGAIGVAEAKFSTGWSSATGTLISDETLVEAAPTTSASAPVSPTCCTPTTRPCAPG